MQNTVTTKAYVVRDNIDTDQIIPAQYLTLVPTIPEEYEKLGSYAMAGLPESSHPIRLIPDGEIKSAYGVIIGGRNFGCGSSREHAPIALGAAGVQAVVAESFARIFFRNCVATGELYPYDSPVRLCDKVKTGDEVTLDFDADTLTVNGEIYQLKPLGEVRPVIDAGGLFNYARQTGMIPAE
jgi:3-isopropylmalate/(R)-2-methylmalate dehydratase small subunit